MNPPVPSLDRPLGMVEWDSLARGYRAADALFKSAEVTPLAIRAVTPGRFLAIFCGEVEAVRTATRAGTLEGRESTYDHLVLPSPHPSLIPAIGARSLPRNVAAVGAIETTSLASALLAADGSAKTGSVRLLEIRLGMGIGGKGLVLLTGAVAQVESAVYEGASLARERGRLAGSVVIPNPDPRLADFLVDPQNPFSDFLL